MPDQTRRNETLAQRINRTTGVNRSSNVARANSRRQGREAQTLYRRRSLGGSGG